MAPGARTPNQIGRYEIVLQIARGGMATVYLARAEDPSGIDRYVALKLTADHLRDDPEFAHHLLEEAKLIAHLRHTNVVPVLDVGEDRRGVFLVMEYVPGDSFGGLLRAAKKANRVVPPRIGMRILVDSLGGLHAAHEHADEEGHPHQLVHRDFNPQNILVGTDGIARLTDFGIAKATSRASITVAGTMKGKVSYASPEQARGDTVDRRCDIWAAGVVAWGILAGRKLFPSTERTLLDIVKAPPPRIRTVVPDVPPALDEAIAYALQMNPADRPASALALARMLAAAAKKADLLADVEEVGAYVQAAVAPVLDERQRKVAAARQKQIPADLLEPGGVTVPMRNRPLAPRSADSFTGPVPPLPPPHPPTLARPSYSSVQELKQSLFERAARFIVAHPALVLGSAAAITVVLLITAAIIFVMESRPAAADTARVPPPVVSPATPPKDAD